MQEVHSRRTKLKIGEGLGQRKYKDVWWIQDIQIQGWEAMTPHALKGKDETLG